MSELNLTIALERYDRHVPLFMGMAKAPAGLNLRVLEVAAASRRHRPARALPAEQGV
jgi:hypothetical protein